MKTKYWFVVAAAVAVGGVTVYSRLSAGDPPLPKVPLTAEVARTDTPQLPLPPVNLPPDEPLVMPPVPVTEAAAVPLPAQKLDAYPTSPVTLASATDPVVPPVPDVPPVPVPSAPPVPAAPALPVPGPVEPPAGPLAPLPVPPAPPVNPGPPVPTPVAPVEPPVAPVAPPTVPTAPVPAPTIPAPPVVPVPDVVPPVPAFPEAKAPAAVPGAPVPVSPAPVPVSPAPVTPLLPTPTPALPEAKAPAAVPPAPATPLLPPPAPTPAPAKPDLKPEPAEARVPEARAPEALAVTGRFVVLQENKLIEGAVSVSDDTVFVSQGAITRKFPKGQVQFVADSRDEVYRFMAAKVPATSAAARLQVARWCMFNGMREQALTEARAVQKLPCDPRAVEETRVRTAAADLARSLELSLQHHPVETVAKMTAPAAPTFSAELVPARPAPPAVLDPEPDVSPEAALVFGARVQPFLANRCTECHAKPDYAGPFKLVRVNPTDAGPQATRTNLRAVAGQLRKDDPGASPLLMKSLSAHGGMKLPAIETRQAVVYQSLEAWTALAVGTPLAAQPVPPPISGPPAPQVGDGSLPLPPVTPVYPTPAAPQLPVPPATTIPLPASPTPVMPPVPVIPPATDAVPPALPPGKLPAPKSVPPIPPADAGVLPLPSVPSVPPAPVGATQFGATIPPKVPATGPTGGDEFDPAGFNQQPKK